MMDLTQKIRYITLKTNNTPPFTQINKIPYIIAQKVFLKTIKKFSQIKSAYLRHSMSQGDFKPGLSDIDYTLILSECGYEIEFEFREKFLTEYLKLRKFFPMLGEIEVIPENNFELWSKIGYRGKQTKNWRLIHGRESRITKIHEEPNKQDLLDEALTRYLGFYMPKIEKNPDYLRKKILDRIGKKIIEKKESNLSIILKTLDTECKKYWRNSPKTCNIEYALNPHTAEKKDFSEYLGKYSSIVKDIITYPVEDGSCNEYFLIISDTSPEKDLINAFVDFKFGHRLLVTPKMFEYIITDLMPEKGLIINKWGMSTKDSGKKFNFPISFDKFEKRLFEEVIRNSVLPVSWVGGEKKEVGWEYLLQYLRAEHYLETGNFLIGDLNALLKIHDKKQYESLHQIFFGKHGNQAEKYAKIRKNAESVLQKISEKY